MKKTLPNLKVILLKAMKTFHIDFGYFPKIKKNWKIENQKNQKNYSISKQMWDIDNLKI